ncbi:MAG: cbb3-type cytochrome oxidase assembly protein CcoS [Silvanigrellales bacterium]|jgi:cbb3-type cytochrome oxidase maturation protein|nr:cbb3-type cytochrome oxidase assembly protein CcoS [Silvanigrellales bacterium]
MAPTLTLIALLLLALLFAGLALVVFLAAVKGGQFDDMETPRHRILVEDEAGPEKRAEN